MNNKKQLKYIGIAVLLSLTFVACKQKRDNATEQKTDILQDTLPNGLRVVIIRDSLAPMVATQITYQAGGYETPNGFPGTAHALEHMMFRDSKGMTGAQLNEITGKMGGENNAFTTMDATQYFFMAPSQYLDILLHIESTRMRGALLSDSDWALEKGAIEQEVSRDISDPGFLAYQQADSILFAGTGYANTALGTRPSFDKTTSKILKGFYNDWYQPNNAIFVIAGDIDPKATFEKVKKLFSAIPNKSIPKRASVELSPFKSQTISKTTPDGTGSVEYMYRMPGKRSNEFAAASVLMDVLNNARSHLSALKVAGKVLSADAWYQSFAHAGIGVIEGGFPKGGNPSQVKTDLDSVINSIIKNGVSADLVEAAKQSEISSFEFNKNSAMDLASAWSSALAWRGLPSLDAAEQQIKDVTVSDVNKIAKKYFSANRITVVLTPNPNGKRPPNSQGFGGAENFAGNDKLNVPLPSWASKPLSELQMPHWTLNPTKMKLENGITLIVQPEKISNTVTVQGYIDNNIRLQEPEGKEGVSQLLSNLFDYGCVDLSRDSFHKALDKISANEYGGTSFGISVLSKSFDQAMKLLADNELHPALPEAAFKTEQKSLAKEIEGQMQSPQYKAEQALYKSLYPTGDPELRHATPESVQSLTLNDVKDFFSKAYRPDMTTIVVVGNITPDEAKEVVNKYFGNWKATGTKPDVILKPILTNKPNYVAVNNSYASQDQVWMAHLIALNIKDTARYALELGNEILGGNGFASRLMVDVRVKHGFAYGAGSYMGFGRSRSLFYVYYGCDPSKVAPVDTLVYKNLSLMQDSLVSETELKNARQAEIRNIPVGVSSINAIASSLINWNRDGLPLNEPMVAAKHYLHISAKQIQNAFKQYIKPENLVQIVQGPKPPKH